MYLQTAMAQCAGLGYVLRSLLGYCAPPLFWQEIGSTEVNRAFGPARSFLLGPAHPTLMEGLICQKLQHVLQLLYRLSHRSWASKKTLMHSRVWKIPFFDQIWIPNIIRSSEIMDYQIPNTIRYWQNPNTKYQILFGIKKIRIINLNSTIWSNYSNTEF